MPGYIIASARLLVPCYGKVRLILNELRPFGAAVPIGDNYLTTLNLAPRTASLWCDEHAPAELRRHDRLFSTPRALSAARCFPALSQPGHLALMRCVSIRRLLEPRRPRRGGLHDEMHLNAPRAAHLRTEPGSESGWLEPRRPRRGGVHDEMHLNVRERAAFP
jgi:hypothetical protein